MRLSVRTDQSRSVHGEDDMQVLDADIVNDLIIRALQEGGINTDDRRESAHREAGRKCHRMLLCDPDIEEPVREDVVEPLESDSLLHRRRDRDNLRITRRQLDHDGRENIRPGRLGL